MIAITRTPVSALLLGGVFLLASSAAEAAPFQRYLNGTCNTGVVCNIDFPDVPAGKRLEIKNYSCYLSISNDSRIRSKQLLVIAANGRIAHAVTLLPVYFDSYPNGNETTWAANHSGFVFTNAGQNFRAYAELRQGSFKQFACHISGELVNAQ